MHSIASIAREADEPRVSDASSDIISYSSGTAYSLTIEHPAKKTPAREFLWEFVLGGDMP